jgi:hypothetical protein
MSLLAAAAAVRTAWVPESFDTHDNLPANCWRHADAAKLVLDHIIRHQRPDKSGWSWLSYNHAVAVLGSARVWKRVCDGLERAGVIQIDRNSWFKGPAPRAYEFRLADRWRHRSIVQLQITDQRLLDRLAKARAKARRLHAAVDLHILDNMLPRVTVLKDECLDCARRLWPDPEHRYSIEAQIQRIHKSDYSVKRGALGNRLFTELTGHPRRLIQFLRIDGQPLAGFNNRNCQPLLQSLHAVNTLAPKDLGPAKGPARGRREGGRREKPGERRHRPQPTRSHRTSGFAPMNGHILTSVPNLPPDLALQLRESERGAFYGWFADLMYGLESSRPLTIDEAKELWLEFVMGKHWPTSSRFQRYARECPFMARCLADLKRGDHCNVARTLQGMESQIMIDGVADLLRMEYPDLPFFTVHDAVYCKSQDLEVVKAVNSEVWARYGVSPQTKDL